MPERPSRVDRRAVRARRAWSWGRPEHRRNKLPPTAQPAPSGRRLRWQRRRRPRRRWWRCRARCRWLCAARTSGSLRLPSSSCHLISSALPRLITSRYHVHHCGARRPSRLALRSGRMNEAQDHSSCQPALLALPPRISATSARRRWRSLGVGSCLRRCCSSAWQRSSTSCSSGLENRPSRAT